MVARRGTFIGGVAVGLLLGLSIAFGVAMTGSVAFARTRDAAVGATTRATSAIARLPIQRSTATPATRHCNDIERVLVRILLESESRGRDSAFFATGTIRNTCNYAMVVRLDFIGVDDRGTSFTLDSIDQVALNQGDERAVFRNLGVRPRAALVALQVIARCYGEVGAVASANPPRCSE
jgi:hypothetical protein